jgi:putative MATE family efflux protein
MDTKSARDFTTGSIPRHLISFATPMLIGNALQAAYNTVDSIWVGRFLGPNSLAAVSVGFPIIFALVALVTGLTIATTALVSQYYGARDDQQLKATIANAMTVLTAAGVVLAIIGYMVRWPMLRLLKAPADIIEEAAVYLGIYMLGLLPTFVYNVCSSILRGLGDSRSPVTFLAIATITNIVLDPLMIFGVWPFPPMGVAGAAWATVFSQSLSAVFAVIHMVRRLGVANSWRDLVKFDAKLTSLTVRIGLPAGAQQMLVSLGMMLVMSTVNSFGSVAVAGSGSGSRIEQFAFMPSMSVSLAVTALVGQNIGAAKQERVPEIVKWALILSCSISGAAMLAAQLIPRTLLSMFTSDAAVLAAGADYLKWLSLAWIPFAANFTMTGVLRGAGDTVATLFTTVFALWLVRVPLVRILASTSLGVTGVWMGMAASPIAAFAATYAYYRSGRWKGRRLVQSVPAADPDITA